MKSWITLFSLAFSNIFGCEDCLKEIQSHIEEVRSGVTDLYLCEYIQYPTDWERELLQEACVYGLRWAAYDMQVKHKIQLSKEDDDKLFFE